MERKAGTVSELRLHPRIVLEFCSYCAGTGRYIAWRNGKPVSEQCTQCSGRGTLVVENGFSA